MKRRQTAFGLFFAAAVLSVFVSCSPPSTPVQTNLLVGKWQRVDKPAVSVAFLQDGTFNAYVSGQRLIGGRYVLVDAEHLVMDFDAQSPKPGTLTNGVSMTSGELRISPEDGVTERYKRAD